MLDSLRRTLHRRQRPARYAQLAELLANQRLSRAQVLARQRADLAAIVDFARKHVPYYRTRYANVAEFGDLPILTKPEVVEHLDELLADNADRQEARIGYTGGSTGTPLAFWYDEAKHELMRAGMMRSYMGSGWQPGQRILNFWGARQDTAAGGVFGAGWSDYIAAERTIAAFEYTGQQLREWANVIRAYRPVLLQGYASILAELARHVLDERMPMPTSLIGVYSTAETLEHWQRELMERAFACKVFNQYGSREVPNIACECRRGKMHVFTDMVYLESTADERLLVTSLTNRLMPMIRYENGDSGRLLDRGCDCGWPFPLMAMGVCRQNDLIRTPVGKTLHPAYFNRLLYGMTQIRQYQWQQVAPDRMLLSVVASPALADEFVAGLGASIRNEVDAAMKLEVRHVDAIARSASGKHRFVIGL
ncbi:MAG: phenylacetate--CoA ligase family protein [Rhodocyclales bacterium]|nr:phenylacetate--CoA ligase family protein [Rhodocyclales bacterium]